MPYQVFRDGVLLAKKRQGKYTTITQQVNVRRALIGAGKETGKQTEMNCCGSNHNETEAADAWSDQIITLSEILCPVQTHVMGVDHQP